MDEKLKSELLAARGVVENARVAREVLKDIGWEDSDAMYIAIAHNNLLDALNEYDKVIK